MPIYIGYSAIAAQWSAAHPTFRLCTMIIVLHNGTLLMCTEKYSPHLGRWRVLSQMADPPPGSLLMSHVNAGDLVVLIQEQGVDVAASFDGGLSMMSSLSSMDEAEAPAAS